MTSVKHKCSICYKSEKCKEEKCNYSNFLGVHFHCLAKQSAKVKKEQFGITRTIGVNTS